MLSLNSYNVFLVYPPLDEAIMSNVNSIQTTLLKIVPTYTCRFQYIVNHSEHCLLSIMMHFSYDLISCEAMAAFSDTVYPVPHSDLIISLHSILIPCF